jgi:hypothetical protein
MATDNKKRLYQGLALGGAFAAVLVAIFLPIFEGKNGLDYLDALYNSISKGSAYYVPDLKKKVAHFEGQEVSVRLTMKDDGQAAQTALLFSKGGAEVQQTGPEVQVKGDVGRILANCLDDTDDMYANRGEKLREKYGYEEKQAMFNWWSALKEMQKDFTRQEKFDLVNLLSPVMKKGVECAYNYYGIQAQSITEKAVIVIISLVFYVIYTIWYGFAVLFLFEGWGLEF